MANGKNMALVVIALIIGASGAGMGAYSIIKYEIVEGPEGPQGEPGLDGDDGLDGTNGDDGSDGDDGVDGVNGTLDNLVAVWESVSGSGVSYKLAYGNIQANNSEFFHLTDSNAHVHLDKEGWYRFTFRFLWNSLELTGHAYVFSYHLNGVFFGVLDRVENPETAGFVVYRTAYVYSDGDDYYYFYCSTATDSFEVYTVQDYNQVVLEYVGVV